MTPVFEIGCVIGTLLLSAGLLHLAASRFDWHPEIPRKVLHVTLGLVALPFPWIFDATWPVAVIAGVTAAVLLAVRFVPVLRRTLGRLLHSVDRVSYGEICHPFAIAILFALSGGNAITYGIPLLILTLADPIAALTGMVRGRTFYQTASGTKSIEGSLAFCAAAVVLTYMPLIAAGVPAPSAFCLALLTGILTMLAESVAWRGLDNALIPLLGFAVLSSHLDLSASALFLRTGLLAGGLLLAIASLRRSARPALVVASR